MGRFDLVSGQEVWRRRMQRFSRSRLTVAEFCDREDVSVAAFYQWRRKLVALGQSSAATARAQSQGGLPAQVVSGAPNGFVPVRVWQSPAIEVRLPNGVTLTLPVGDPEVLRQALLLVSQIPAPAHRVTEGL